jgi:hypothetical protein
LTVGAVPVTVTVENAVINPALARTCDLPTRRAMTPPAVSTDATSGELDVQRTGQLLGAEANDDTVAASVALSPTDMLKDDFDRTMLETPLTMTVADAFQPLPDAVTKVWPGAFPYTRARVGSKSSRATDATTLLSLAQVTGSDVPEGDDGRPISWTPRSAPTSRLTEVGSMRAVVLLADVVSPPQAHRPRAIAHGRQCLRRERGAELSPICVMASDNAGRDSM